MDNHTVAEAAKKVLTELFRDLEAAEARTGVVNLREAAVAEMAKYLIYLAESDGRIKWAEARIIKEYLDLDMQPEEVRGFLKEEEHFDDAFEGEFPSLFKMLIETDNRFYAKGRRESMCASEWMLAAYKCLGISLVEADGEISAGENRKIRAFIQKLEEYLETNLLSDKEKKLKKRRADNE